MGRATCGPPRCTRTGWPAQRQRAANATRDGRRQAGLETPGLVWANTILGNVKRSLDGNHACAPHYAARYLAEFQYRFNRRYELAALPRRLLKAAATTLPLPRPILMLSNLTAAAAPPGVRQPGCAWDRPPALPGDHPGTARGRLRPIPLAANLVLAPLPPACRLRASATSPPLLALYWDSDMNPSNGVNRPQVPDNDLDDLPPIAQEFAAVRRGEHERILRAGKWKDAIQAYLACSSFADAMAGQLVRRSMRANTLTTRSSSSGATMAGTRERNATGKGHSLAAGHSRSDDLARAGRRATRNASLAAGRIIRHVPYAG